MAVSWRSDSKVLAVSWRLLRASIWRMADFARKSAFSASSCSCSARATSSGAFTSTTRSLANPTASQSSALRRQPSTSSTRVRNARRSLDFKNSTARVMEPSQASTAMRACSRDAPVFCTMMPAASLAGMVRNGTTWQRDRMVGSTLSRVRASRISTTSDGGSSSVLRNALAACTPSRSTRSRM